MPAGETITTEKRRPTRTPFDISVDDSQSSPIVYLKGDVDVAVAERLHEELSRLVESGYQQLTIDCAGVTYVDSTGLSELVWAKKRMPEHGRVELIGCSDRLIKLLTVTGLDIIFDLVQVIGA